MSTEVGRLQRRSASARAAAVAAMQSKKSGESGTVAFPPASAPVFGPFTSQSTRTSNRDDGIGSGNGTYLSPSLWSNRQLQFPTASLVWMKASPLIDDENSGFSWTDAMTDIPVFDQQLADASDDLPPAGASPDLFLTTFTDARPTEAFHPDANASDIIVSTTGIDNPISHCEPLDGMDYHNHLVLIHQQQHLEQGHAEEQQPKRDSTNIQESTLQTCGHAGHPLCVSDGPDRSSFQPKREDAGRQSESTSPTCQSFPEAGTESSASPMFDGNYLQPADRLKEIPAQLPLLQMQPSQQESVAATMDGLALLQAVADVQEKDDDAAEATAHCSAASVPVEKAVVVDGETQGEGNLQPSECSSAAGLSGSTDAGDDCIVSNSVTVVTSATGDPQGFPDSAAAEDSSTDVVRVAAGMVQTPAQSAWIEGIDMHDATEHRFTAAAPPHLDLVPSGEPLFDAFYMCRQDGADVGGVSLALDLQSLKAQNSISSSNRSVVDAAMSNFPVSMDATAAINVTLGDGSRSKNSGESRCQQDCSLLQPSETAPPSVVPGAIPEEDLMNEMQLSASQPSPRHLRFSLMKATDATASVQVCTAVADPPGFDSMVASLGEEISTYESAAVSWEACRSLVDSLLVQTAEQIAGHGSGTASVGSPRAASPFVGKAFVRFSEIVRAFLLTERYDLVVLSDGSLHLLNAEPTAAAVQVSRPVASCTIISYGSSVTDLKLLVSSDRDRSRVFLCSSAGDVACLDILHLNSDLPQICTLWLAHLSSSCLCMDLPPSCQNCGASEVTALIGTTRGIVQLQALGAEVVTKPLVESAPSSPRFSSLRRSLSRSNSRSNVFTSRALTMTCLDDRYALVGCDSGAVFVVDSQRGETLATWMNLSPEGPLLPLESASDGDCIEIVFSDCTTRRFQYRQEERVLSVAEGSVVSLCSRCGASLVGKSAVVCRRFIPCVCSGGNGGSTLQIVRACGTCFCASQEAPHGCARSDDQ